MKQFQTVFQEFIAAHPAALTKPFARCEVVSVSHDADADVLRVLLRGAGGAFPDTAELTRAMALFFTVGRAEASLTAPLSAFDTERAVCVMSNALPSLNGFFRDAGWQAGSDTITITPRVEIPADMACGIRESCLRVLSERYEGLKAVEIAESGNRFNPDAFGAEREARVRAVAEQASARAPVSAGKPKALLGKPFKAKPIPMSQITGAASVCVAGMVFAVDSAETRTGARLSFDMTDGGGAVRVQRFFKKLSDFNGKAPGADPSHIPGLVKAGDTLEVRGKMEWRGFGESDELILTPSDIQTAELPIERADDEPVKRVELHLHTNMSSMDAMTDPDKLLKRCAEWGHTAVAVTDHGVLHAFPDVMKARFKHIKGSFKVLYGCEAYLRDESAKARGRKMFHIILFAKNAAGMRSLFELTSQAHIKGFRSRPALAREDIAARREDLVIGAACEAGELFSAVTGGETWDGLLKICEFYDYLEIQPLCNNMFMLQNGTVADVEQLREFNRTVCRLGTESGKPVVATGDVHFLDPGDEIFRKIIMNAKDMDHDRPIPLFLRTTREMLDEFEYLGRDKAYEVVVTNTNLIADRIEELQPVRKDIFFPPRIEGSAAELRGLALSRMTEIYGDPPPEHIQERVRLELEPIIDGGYDVIYMAAHKLVAQSLADGYTVGSRGSVGSSIVAYLAGITEVNALPPHYRCPSCRWNDF
ncbi:MAG: PHP domain-containing protein, partial [Oscillospiraceae bacterium]|nr:PHP domain-containing protein [Oscillospiraceae bacterium]